jgi:hypothetical protein
MKIEALTTVTVMTALFCDMTQCIFLGMYKSTRRYIPEASKSLDLRYNQPLCTQAHTADSLKLSIFILIFSVDTAFDHNPFFYTEVSVSELIDWLPDSANINGKGTRLNTEVRKLFTIFAMFGIFMLKDMGSPKWRYETD